MPRNDGKNGNNGNKDEIASCLAMTAKACWEIATQWGTVEIL